MPPPPSLSLQRSMFRAQQRQIDRAVAKGSASFRRYEARYRRSTRRYSEAVSMAEVRDEVGSADLVFVGDYHTLKVAQSAYLDLVQHALTTGRRVVLALEVVEARHQQSVDAFLAGRLTERTFLHRIGHSNRGAFDLWPGFRPIFELARARGLRVWAIDRRAEGKRSLEVRDAFAATIIAGAAAADDRPLVLVLVGQFHVAPPHLPARVHRTLGQVQRRSLIVYQNAEGVYWRLAARGLVTRTAAVRIRSRELCLVNASPVVCQRSFLDYVEAESGDAPLEESGIGATFRRLAKDIGRLVGVPLRRALEEVEVATASDLSPLNRIARRARFTKTELKALKRHLMSRESAWIPRARVAWLASLSLNHAAEEAAHFVRHVAVGPAMEAPRSRVQAFWARCLEEALGFFGSRLINPARRSPGTDEWVALFHRGTPRQRRTAAFVLALTSVEPDDGQDTARLLPLSDPALFDAVSHSLGYCLGDALARAFEAGTLSRQEVRQLFRDPFENPAASLRALRKRFAPRQRGAAAESSRAA